MLSVPTQQISPNARYYNGGCSVTHLVFLRIKNSGLVKKGGFGSGSLPKFQLNSWLEYESNNKPLLSSECKLRVYVFMQVLAGTLSLMSCQLFFRDDCDIDHGWGTLAHCHYFFFLLRVTLCNPVGMPLTVQPRWSQTDRNLPASGHVSPVQGLKLGHLHYEVL